MLRKSRVASIAADQPSLRGAWFAVPAGHSWWRRRSPSALPGDTRSARADEIVASEAVAVDGDAAGLFVDHGESAARTRWAERLSKYVDQQGPIDALRLRSPSEPPWPNAENPMVGYLIERGSEIVADDGLDAALEWLAANAWFEGVVAERVRIARLLDDE